MGIRNESNFPFDLESYCGIVLDKHKVRSPVTVREAIGDLPDTES